VFSETFEMGLQVPTTVEITVIRPNGRRKVLPNLRRVEISNGTRLAKYKGRMRQLTDNNEIDLRCSHHADTSIVEDSEPSPVVTTQILSSSNNDPIEPISNEGDGQEEVIKAPPTERLLVDAGPGAGKSHVACARVLELVQNHRIQASRIWMVSFTRTAVREVRDRIDLLSEEVGDQTLKGLRPTTLDSLAARLRLGSGDILAESYNENIIGFIKALQENEGLREEISNTKHVLIDEAQDIVGPRADLVCQLIETLPEDCGVTIFVDAAQAIYGFSEGDARGYEESLLERIASMDFKNCQLSGQYRTDVPNLLEIFSSVRGNVLDKNISAEEREVLVRTRIVELAGKSSEKIEELDDLDSDSFVLYRKRIQALYASSLLNQKGIKNRLRLSGLPTVIHPWVAGALSYATERRVRRSRFNELWEENVSGTILETISMEEAWNKLASVAENKHGRLDLGDLSEILSRRPPIDLCLPEFGESGPVLGTIHAAKGREAGTVHLMLGDPSSNGNASDEDREEETRVVFVGATRARKKLFVGSSQQLFGSKKLESGRAMRSGNGRRGPFAQVEVGREQDLVAENIVGLDAVPSVKLAREIQSKLPDLIGTTIVAKNNKVGQSWRYQFFITDENTGNELLLGCLSEKFSHDIWEAAKKVNCRRSPGLLPFIHIVGLRTIATTSRDQLHEPWQTSGLALAPLVIGLTYFKGYSGDA
jgi:hypothetical protein